MAEEEEEKAIEKPVQKKSFSTEFIVAMAAIIISLATLFVYIYQARIMQSQQQASVWPYVEWTMGFSTTDGVHLSVINKGVGPAIIKSTELYLDGKRLQTPRELMSALTQGKVDSMYSFTETVDKRVISPGEEIRFFHMKGESLMKIDFGKVYDRIKYNIRYESIYGDCWVSTGLEVTPGECE